MNNLGLGFVFTARDLASSKMQGLERRFTSLDERVTGGTERMTGAFRQLGVGLAIFTAGAATVAGALALANAAGKFEQGLAAVGAVSRATTRELGMLRQAAIDAGIQTQFSPDEAVDGLQSLATAGQTAEQATRTLIPVLDLAAGSLGQLGVAQSAEAVVGTLNAYGMTADKAAGVTDKLLRITQLTNFQTRDFDIGLAKAAASGSVFSQSLDDVLITMGLLRNRNIDASSSATAFREAVRRVGAESRAQNAILGTGVDIFDKSTGKMRSIVDIMSDFAQATTSMTEAERNRRVATAFGARGLLAFNAVLNASFTATRDGTKVMLKGAEAIAALRKEMGQAEGTAASFREQLLDTFEGQKTLLKGTLQTFAVVLGEPFAAVFKPVVRILVEVLNAILRAFQAIPAPIKKVLAGVVLAAGAFLTLVGGLIAAKATIALLGIGLKALGVSLGGLVATLLPAILIVGALVAVVAGFAVAFKKNLGGIGDFARRLWRRVSLFFQGLKQLFEQGGFSGAVRKELTRAENSGLKRFLIAMYQVVHRIKQVWEGFKEGFTRSIEEARPVFEDLADALSELGREVTAIFSGLTSGAASLPSSQFRSFGQVAGAAIATVVTWITRLVAVLTRITTGVLEGFQYMVQYIKPALNVVREAIGDLVDTWNDLTGTAKDARSVAGKSASGWRSFGEVLGKTVGGAVTVITLALGGLIKVITAVIWVVNLVKDVFVAVGTVIGETAAKIYLWFTETLPAAISSAVSTVVGFFQRIGAFFARIGRWFQGLFASMASGIKSFFKPVVDFFEGVLRTVRRVINGIQDFVIKLLRKIPDKLLPSHLVQLSRQPLSTEVRGRGGLQAEGGTRATASRAEAASSSMPAAVAARGRSDELARLGANMQTNESARSKGRGQAPPLNINVQVDGETIARASHKASRDVAARSFSPVPAY